MKIIGVDFQDLREKYQDVLPTALRADPTLLVICNSAPGDADLKMAKLAWCSGHSVLLIEARHLAPLGTEWLRLPIP